MAFVKFEWNQFIIDGEIAKKHMILADHFLFDGEYSVPHNMVKMSCKCFVFAWLLDQVALLLRHVRPLPTYKTDSFQNTVFWIPMLGALQS